jgi:hypothetical protein
VPASPADGEQYARQVLRVVEDLEARLFAMLRQALKDEPDSPTWEARRLAEVQRIRQYAARDTRRALVELEDLIRDLVLHAYNHGAALALDDLDELGQPVKPGGLPAVAHSETFRNAAMRSLGGLDRVLPQILSAAYTEAVAAGGVEVLSGGNTRLQASQHVLDRLLSDGIRGFTDGAGRQWSLETYTEMAVRTVTGQAAVQGHVDQLQSAGLDLVQVSDSPRECPLCRPWEGKVLSIGGTVGAAIAPSVITGEAVTVKVAGTVAQAKAAGLQHPNCTHRLVAYLPGATKLKPKAEPDGYAQKQRQREIERRIRSWKRREQLALTDDAAAAARRKVRAWQQELRDHIDAHDLKRLRHREQIGSPGTPLAR